MNAQLEIRMLGPLEVARDGRTVDLGGHRQRALLAALLVRGGEVVSTERLIEELWGEQAPASAPNMIQVYVSRLRKALGREVLVTQPPGYMLRLGEAELDASRLVDLLVRARHAMADARAGDALDMVTHALGMWRGPPLADLTYERFAQGEVARLEELRLEAIELRIEAELALGRHAQLVGELEQLIALHPFRERLREQLMLALYRSGRQAEALEAYQAARSAMADELGIEPNPALRGLEHAILTQDPRLEVATAEPELVSPSAVSAIGKLPPELTSLVGREGDLARVEALLATRRLVTLVGPGGVGKTRVALRVAGTIADRFEHGACFADLSVNDEPDEVASEVSSALGIRDRPGSPALETIVEVLRDRNMLVVLDNCEHVLGAASEVARRVVSTCHGVRILATSRAPLATSGESVLRLQPLPTGGNGSEPPPAVALFLDRAESHGVSREQPEEMLAPIREICARLDGIPLAIELAAARTRAISPAELLTHLDDRLALLTRPIHWSAHARQQTLEATIAWSYELLSTAEQATLRRLSVFHGGFSLPAAAAACADLGGLVDTLECLTALVDCSVVLMEPRIDGDRYRMLESVALFAAQRLREHDEEHYARERHAGFFAELARDLPDRRYHDPHTALATRLDTEQDNLTAALSWCLDGEGEASRGAELAARLGFHWTCRGRVNTARHWLGRALECAPQIAPTALAAVHLAYVILAYSHGEIDEAGVHASEAARIARECGDDELLAEALADLALNHQARGRDASAIAAELRTLQARLSTPRARVLALLGTAQVALGMGYPDQGAVDATSAWEIARTVGDHCRAAMSGFWLAYALALNGGVGSARTAIRQAGEDAARSGYELLVADNQCAEITLAVAAGDLETAERLLPQTVRMLCHQERWQDAGGCLLVAAVLELKDGFEERSAQLLGAALRWADQLDFQDALLLPEFSQLKARAERPATDAWTLAFHRGANMTLESAAEFLDAGRHALPSSSGGRPGR